jgi:hypothetical protein
MRWIGDYDACFQCYMPQSICTERKNCQYRDTIIPLCVGGFLREDTRQVINDIRRDAKKALFEEDDKMPYMLWLGEGAKLGTIRCIQANLVASKLVAHR